MRCALNGVAYRMAEVGEVIATGAGRGGGRHRRLVRRLDRPGARPARGRRGVRARGRRASAAGAWLRSANYAFAGFWYVLGTSAPERAAAAWEDHRTGLRGRGAALAHAHRAARACPSRGPRSRATSSRPPASAARPLPLVVIVNGLDTPVSDALMIGAEDAVARGATRR